MKSILALMNKLILVRSSKLTIAYLVVLFFSFACLVKNEEIPAHIIGEDQMVEILCDLYLSEVSVHTVLRDTSEIKYFTNKYKTEILDSFNVSAAQLDSSYNFYLHKPKYFAKIHDSVHVRLDRIKKNIEKKM